MCVREGGEERERESQARLGKLAARGRAIFGQFFGQFSGGFSGFLGGCFWAFLGAVSRTFSGPILAGKMA